MCLISDLTQAETHQPCLHPCRVCRRRTCPSHLGSTQTQLLRIRSHHMAAGWRMTAGPCLVSYMTQGLWYSIPLRGKYHTYATFVEGTNDIQHAKHGIMWSDVSQFQNMDLAKNICVLN